MSRKHSQSDDHPPGDDQLATVDSDPGEAYYVDRIVSERTDADGITRYLVQWEDYPPEAASREPAEQFDGDEILREWVRQRAEGDELDPVHLAEFEGAMATYNAGLTTVEHGPEKDPTEDQNTIAVCPKNGSKVQSDIRLPKRKAALSLSRHIAQPPTKRRREDSTITKSASRGNTDRPRQRQPSTGARFNNLQHMGRARRKAAQEAPVNPNDPNLKFVFGGPSTGSLVTSPIVESPLFFPEKNSQPDNAPAKDSEPTQPARPVTTPVLTRRLLTSPKNAATPTFPKMTVPVATSSGTDVLPIQGCTEDQGRSMLRTATKVRAEQPAGLAGEAPGSRAHLTPQVTDTQPNPTVRKAVNGRTWSRDELVVHLSLGNFTIGDVKMVNLNERVRGELIRLKKEQGKYRIEMHFEQELVLSPDQFQDLSSTLRDIGQKCRPVVPFEDTAGVCRELAHDYLQAHDLTATWYHPSASYIFLMFSPRSPAWLQKDPYRNMQVLPDLVVEVLETNSLPAPPERAMSGGEPAKWKKSTVCTFWQQNRCWNGESCAFAHTLNPTNENTSTLQSGANTVPVAKAGRGVPERRQSAPTEHPIANQAVARARRSSFTTPTVTPPVDLHDHIGQAIQEARRASFTISSAKPEVDSQKKKSASEDLENAANVTVDWTVNFEYTKMVKPIKKASVAASEEAVFFISFPEQHALQAKMLEQWACKHTNARLVFEAREWNLFLKIKSDDPKILLFHETGPHWACLENINKVLHCEELLVYNVSWTTPTIGRPVYTFTQLFPRALAVLLTEDVMISSSVEATSIIRWFEGFSVQKSPEYGINKLMLRPNVVNWLQTRALAFRKADKKKEMTEVLDLMVAIQRLLPSTADATVPGLSSTMLSSSLSGDVQNTNIVPFPFLDDYGYNDTPTASTEAADVQARDKILVEYFTALSLLSVASIRKFLVLQGGKSTPPQDAAHITFRSAVTFAQNECSGKK